MATAAAAIVGKARRDVISHFMQCNAVSAASAVPWTPDRRLQRRVLARFVGSRVLIETEPGTYFVDVPAYDRWRRSTRRRAAMMVLGVGVAGVVLAALA
jgi:hypothetical protein